ncbi:hypothetical protein ACRAWG_06630 [Methylobacterium sp. P31]
MKRDLATSLSDEADRVGARIDKSYGKLATKLRRRADKAKAAMIKSKNSIKRAVLQRRFETYANAARDIDQSVMDRQVYAGPVLRLKPDERGTSAQP